MGGSLLGGRWDQVVGTHLIVEQVAPTTTPTTTTSDNNNLGEDLNNQQDDEQSMQLDHRSTTDRDSSPIVLGTARLLRFHEVQLIPKSTTRPGEGSTNSFGGAAPLTHSPPSQDDAPVR